MQTPRNTRTSRPSRAPRSPRTPRFEPLEARELLSALPDPSLALTLNEIKGVFSACVARATQLGVNATISLVDREGNILGVVRMRDTTLRFDTGQSTIIGGGVGGLEGISLPSSIFATSKAGTAAFLSTTGNAFSTRTAGFIIQQNFPGGAKNAPSGPLFGVQLSSLPTSDLNRLPIGLAGDPGGLPLYRSGTPIAGIGVELDGVYSAPASRLGSQPTDEERIAAAALTSFPPPGNIRANNILVGGIRFAFLEAGIPSASDLGTLPDFDTLVAANRLTVLSQPAVSPATRFATRSLGTIPGDTIFGFQQNYVETFAVRGDTAFAVQPTSTLVRRLNSISIATGASTFVADLSGPAAGQVPVGHRTNGVSLDDRATADPADDRLYLSNQESGNIHAFSAATGAPLSATATTPATPLRDAQVIQSGGNTFVVGITSANGNLVRLDAAQFGSGGATVVNLTPAGPDTIDSFTNGEAGVFAVRAGPVGVLSAKRELIRVNLDGTGSTLIANISDNGPNEGSNSQPIPVLVYDNNNTVGVTADDTLIAQNSTRGTQFRMNVATAAIAAPQIEIVNPSFVLTSARQGPNGTIVGVSDPYTGSGGGAQLQRLTVADVTNAANLTSLTGIDTTALTRAGVLVNGTPALTPAEVETILTQAHRENARLRAAIRRDRPQVSQVTVSVCDLKGNLLGVFRTPDAPVFGFDVSLQKARSAMFFSRPDAGTILDTADAGVYARFANAVRAQGVPLDGSIAIAERTIGFIARPTLPDGIPRSGPGGLSALAPDTFSPFNTGLQTQLTLPNIFRYAFEFLSVNEADALRLFNRDLIGGGNVTTNAFPLQNGLQIFPGAVPLYKNGQLVGGVGVSGDGIEQDDSIAFNGAGGFQQFGPGVQRADKIRITQKLRLPYIKFPRKPSGGF
ncbi:MAG: heme-binding protein [Phycisphaerales bacterium]